MSDERKCLDLVSCEQDGGLAQYLGYQIFGEYDNLQIYAFDSVTKLRQSTRSVFPMKNFTHRERYEVIAEKLREAGLPVPEMTPELLTE